MSRRKPRHIGAPSSTDVANRAAALDDALDHAGHRIDPAAARGGRELVGRVSERMRLSADHTVVALAGATGSGKSSLFNALTGLDIATVGARRPTTATATACVYGAENADALLEWLGVPRQHRVSHESALDSGDDRLRGLVLLDLPDHDSTELSHRLEVDRLIELVDVFVWVTDPQKYADAALHRRYLAPLAGHDAVTVVVLNQADRLTPEALESCRRDLQRLVAADGLGDVEVLTTSAVHGDGVPGLREELAAAVDRRNAWLQRLSADLDSMVLRLQDQVAPGEPSVSQLTEGSGLVDALCDASGVTKVVQAVEQAYERDAALAAGWPFTRWARRLRPDPLRRLRLRPGSGSGGTSASGSASGSGGSTGGGAGASAVDPDLVRSSLPAASAGQRTKVEVALRRVGERAAEGLPGPWADAARAAAAPSPQDLRDAADQAVVSTDLGLRRPAWWRVLGAVQLLLAVVAVVGLLWLVALAVTGWLKLPEPGTPYLGPIPVPTLMLLGGLLIGVLLGFGARVAARSAARRRGARARDRLTVAVGGVVDQRVVQPAAAVLADHRATREALHRISS